MLPYKNIFKSLKINRIITISIIGFAAIISIFSIYQVRRIHEKSLDKAFVIDPQGSVFPLQEVYHKEYLEVESRAHLERFLFFFYELNSINYRDRLSKALWLGDQSVDQLYKQKKEDGVYNRILQYSLLQKIEGSDFNVRIQGDKIHFTAEVILKITRGEVNDLYNLKVTGQLIKVARKFPENPHGLLITDYYEQQLIKIDQ
ncbi:MAG: conjugal transfer protein TraK [Bacteroidota bacterium]